MSLPVAEPSIVVRNREDLVYLLCEASELEHGILCSYLFTALSLKDQPDEGLSPDQLRTVARWKRTIIAIAVQEMLHLTLASNLLTAIGAAPHFRRPNFPQRSAYYPPSFRLELMPFSESILRHFIFVERPEGLAMDDAPDLLPLFPQLPDVPNEIGPGPEEFATVGHLYRGIEDGFRVLVGKLGEQRVFIGPPRAQATRQYFRFPGLVPTIDLDSAITAIETIVEEGEGARGDWVNSHYGTFLRIQEEFAALKAQDPSFQPARPVLPNPFPHQPGDTTGINLIDDPFTIEVSDLFNASYQLMVQLLTRFFAHSDETDEELGTLIDSAIDIMFTVIRPLGEMLTRLPAGPSFPGQTAGPSFIFLRSAHLLPHRLAAWIIFEERMRELADFAGKLAESPGAPDGLGVVQRELMKMANTLGARASGMVDS